MNHSLNTMKQYLNNSVHHKRTPPVSLLSRRLIKTNVIPLFGDDEINTLDEDMEPEPDSFYFDEVPVWPRKPESYDFRTNESYKKYRKHIECLTIKKPDETLLDC